MFIPYLSLPSIFPYETSTKPCLSPAVSALPVFCMRRLTLREDRNIVQGHTAKECGALVPILELA